MNTILVGKDCLGQSIEKGNHVVIDDGQHGEIKAVWDNGSVDVHVADAHQGPVVDSFDIKDRQVLKTEYWE